MIPFLKTDTPGLAQLEGFLRGRGYELKPVTSVKDFIESVIQEHSPFAILCLDHKHPKIVQISQLLEQGYNINIIGITEQSSHLGNQIIKSANLKHSAPIPVSGPGLERVLKAFVEGHENLQIKKGNKSLNRDLIAVTGKVDHDSLKARDELSRFLKSETMNVPGWLPVEKPKPTVTTQVVCLMVEAPQLHGYLVAAIGSKRTIDEPFFEQIRMRLLSFLKSAGDIQPKDFFSLSVREVAFEPWALRQAEVLKKTVHGDDEVAVAFFPRPLSEMAPETDSEPMIRINIAEIEPDEPMRFDVFLHLPANNRYILYVAEGKKMELPQKTRLLEHGITHLHTKRDSIQALKRFRAERFIQQQIEQFETLVKGENAT